MRNIRYIKIDSPSYIIAIAYVTISCRNVEFLIWEYLLKVELAIRHYPILQGTFAIGKKLGSRR